MSTRRFIVTRALLTIPMIITIATVVFVVMRVIPGDPVTTLLGATGISEEYLQQIRHQLGLDRPIYVQYIDYVSRLLLGDWGGGMSLVRRIPVAEEVLNYFPATLELTMASVIYVILGIYIGVFAARKKGKKIDVAIRMLLLIRWCTPVFWLGIVMQIFLGVTYPILPIAGRIDPTIALQRITGLYVLDSILTGNLYALASSLKHLVLPAFTLGTTTMATVGMLTRTNMIDVLGEEYIRVARLKGCPEEIVFQKHALPNALIPILTYAGLQFSALLGGAILTETVFNWPGLGRNLLFAVYQRDFNLIQGCIVFFALVVGIVNLVIDISYSIVDPRVRY